MRKSIIKSEDNLYGDSLLSILILLPKTAIMRGSRGGGVDRGSGPHSLKNRKLLEFQSNTGTDPL